MICFPWGATNSQAGHFCPGKGHNLLLSGSSGGVLDRQAGRPALALTDRKKVISLLFRLLSIYKLLLFFAAGLFFRADVAVLLPAICHA